MLVWPMIKRDASSPTKQLIFNFEGWKKRGFEFSNDSNGPCILQVDITTLSGELDIIVMDAADQEIYSYKNLASS